MKRGIVVFLVLVFLPLNSFASTCITIADGNINSGSIWSCTPGSSWLTADSIIVEHNLTVPVSQEYDLQATFFYVTSEGAMVFGNNSGINLVNSNAVVYIGTGGTLSQSPPSSNAARFFSIADDCFFGNRIECDVDSRDGPLEGPEVINCPLDSIWDGGEVDPRVFASECLEILEQLESGILPVAFGSVNAYESGNKIVVKWKTLWEEENDYFVVLRSHNLLEWVAVGVVYGNQTTTNINYYQFVDSYPLIGLNFYKIRQFDNNGSSAYSRHVVVDFKGSEANSNPQFMVFPNPGNQTIFFKSLNETEGLKSSLVIYSFDGLIWKTGIYEQGTPIDIGNIPPGNYFVNLTGLLSGKSFVKKLVVQ